MIQSNVKRDGFGNRLPKKDLIYELGNPVHRWQGELALPPHLSLNRFMALCDLDPQRKDFGGKCRLYGTPGQAVLVGFRDASILPPTDTINSVDYQFFIRSVTREQAKEVRTRIEQQYAEHAPGETLRFFKNETMYAKSRVASLVSLENS